MTRILTLMCEGFSREVLLSGGRETETGQVTEDFSLEATGNGMSWSKGVLGQHWGHWAL